MPWLPSRLLKKMTIVGYSVGIVSKFAILRVFSVVFVFP